MNSINTSSSLLSKSGSLDELDDLFNNYNQDASMCSGYKAQMIEVKEKPKEKNRQEKLYKIGTVTCTVGGVIVLGGKAIKLLSRIIED